MQQLDNNTAATSEPSSDAEERPDLSDKGKTKIHAPFFQTHLWSQENYGYWIAATFFAGVGNKTLLSRVYL